MFLWPREILKHLDSRDPQGVAVRRRFGFVRGDLTSFEDEHLDRGEELFTIAPMYRYGAPGRGRYREHWQLSVEAIGTDDPDLDVDPSLELLDLIATQVRLRLHARIGHTLDTLFRQTLFAELDRRGERAEIWCVANACTDDTAAVAARIFQDQGAAHAHALGLEVHAGHGIDHDQGELLLAGRGAGLRGHVPDGDQLHLLLEAHRLPVDGHAPGE